MLIAEPCPSTTKTTAWWFEVCPVDSFHPRKDRRPHQSETCCISIQWNVLIAARASRCPVTAMVRGLEDLPRRSEPAVFTADDADCTPRSKRAGETGAKLFWVGRPRIPASFFCPATHGIGIRSPPEAAFYFAASCHINPSVTISWGRGRGKSLAPTWDKRVLGC